MAAGDHVGARPTGPADGDGEQAPGGEKGCGRWYPQPHRQWSAPWGFGVNFRRPGDRDLFLPQTQRLSSRQYWLAYNVAPEGAILVDTGARQALVRLGRSLLPAGILEVFGGFQKGAPVNLIDPEGQTFAVGLSNYSSQDINRIKGKQTQEIAQSLGHKDYDEVIHRDNLVIFPEFGSGG